jgi:molybdenum cofactor cytidylyltransferase
MRECFVRRVSAKVLEGCRNHRRTSLLRTADHITGVRAKYFIYTRQPMVSAVVLAAGASTRMGRQKLLLPLGRETLVRRVVEAVCKTGFDDVLVVVGSEHQEVIRALDGLSVRHALNPDFATGMGSSFRTAVANLPDSDAAMFALADQPFVTSQEYRRVLDSYLHHNSPLVSVRYGDVMAPPHLFAREFFAELAVLEHGARPVLLRHRDKTTVLTFAPELLVDVDTPEDYDAVKRRLSSGS